MEIVLYIAAGMLAVLIAVLIAVLVRVSKRTAGTEDVENRRRGRNGEELVDAILGTDEEGVRRVLTNYRFFHDGLVREVDHILIDGRGVFVLETKNWSGKIFGRDDDDNWTQILGNDDVFHAHQNPVKQNNGHVYHLKNILDGDMKKRIWLIPLVVFVQNNVENIESDCVVALSVLQQKLDSYPFGQLSPQDIEIIYQSLLSSQYKS